MLHLARRLVLEVLSEINDLEARLHVLTRDTTDPTGNGRREETQLDVVVGRGTDGFEDRVDVLLEAELEHLISLVENDTLELAEVDVAAVDVVEDTTSRTNEDVNTVTKLARLIVDADATIHSQDFELVVVVLDLLELSTDLQGELSGGSQDDGLDLSVTKHLVLSEVLDNGQTEGERLAGTCEVTSHYVVSLEDGIEAVLLDGEQVDNLLLLERKDSLLRELGERTELTVSGRSDKLLGSIRRAGDVLKSTDIIIILTTSIVGRLGSELASAD